MLGTTGKIFFVYYDRELRDRGGCPVTRVESKAVENRLPAYVSRGGLVVSFFFFFLCFSFFKLRTLARAYPSSSNKAPAAPAF